MKKGLTYTAIGFLLTLINFELIINENAVSMTPDFLRWILFGLRRDLFGNN